MTTQQDGKPKCQMRVVFSVGLEIPNHSEERYEAILRGCVASASLVDAAERLRLEVAHCSAPVGLRA